jgi:hypothetical protein
MIAWAETKSPATTRFDPRRVAGLSEPLRRYLSHAIAPGALVASAVRLRMHGEIKLKNAWVSR